MIEEGIEKVTVQPLVHDPAFINPSTDADGAEGFVLAVWCDAPPEDGDIAVYVAASDRFELRPQSALAIGSPVTVEDGSGGFLFVFDEAGNVVYA